MAEGHRGIRSGGWTRAELEGPVGAHLVHGRLLTVVIIVIIITLCVRFPCQVQTTQSKLCEKQEFPEDGTFPPQKILFFFFKVFNGISDGESKDILNDFFQKQRGLPSPGSFPRCLGWVRIVIPRGRQRLGHTGHHRAASRASFF